MKCWLGLGFGLGLGLKFILEHGIITEKNFVWRFCGFNAKVQIDLTTEMPSN